MHQPLPDANEQKRPWFRCFSWVARRHPERFLRAVARPLASGWAKGDGWQPRVVFMVAVAVAVVAATHAPKQAPKLAVSAFGSGAFLCVGVGAVAYLATIMVLVPFVRAMCRGDLPDGLSLRDGGFSYQADAEEARNLTRLTRQVVKLTDEGTVTKEQLEVIVKSQLALIGRVAAIERRLNSSNNRRSGGTP